MLTESDIALYGPNMKEERKIQTDLVLCVFYERNAQKNWREENKNGLQPVRLAIEQRVSREMLL